MKKEDCDLLIIGGGLSALAIAYFLRNSDISIKIIEARERLGGRIHTLYEKGSAPLEMGATWLGKKHQVLGNLLKELGLETFPQVIGPKAIYEAISTSPFYLAQLPPNPEPSLRISGGTSTLIKKLSTFIAAKDIILNEKVESIDAEGKEYLEVKSKSCLIKAKKVVSTLPPNLLLKSIDITPGLPRALVDIAMMTHTWMGESIKIALTFKEAFWRSPELSGTVISNVGPIAELYDHSNIEDNYFALKGFFSGNYFNVSKADRLNLILGQLRKYFGKKVEEYIAYEETVWRNEEYTFTSYQENVLPHQHNGHPTLRQSYLDGKFFLGGTETASIFPGYMEGAVVRANEISKELLV